MGIQKVSSGLFQVAPRASWIIAAIVGCEAIWIAQTFLSSTLLVPLVLLFSISLALSLWMSAGSESEKDFAARESATNRKRVAKWSLFVLIAALISVVVVVERVSTHVGESVNALIALADVLSHLAWLITAFMFVALPRTGHPMMLPMGMVIAMVTIAAGGVSQTLNSQTAAALMFCIVFVVGSQTVGVATAWLTTSTNAGLPMGQATHAAWKQNAKSGAAMTKEEQMEATSGLKWLMSLAVLSAILTMTSTLARATQEVLPSVQSFVHDELKDNLERITIGSPVGTGMYVNGTHFGSVRDSLVRNPLGIAINAHAESAPGYLRGNAFDVFNDRRWLTIEMIERYERTRFSSVVYDRQIEPSDLPTTSPKFPYSRKIRHFDIQQPRNAADGIADLSFPLTQPVEVQNFSNRGSVVFTPASTVWFEASSRRLTVSHHEIVSGSGVDVTQPYIAGVSNRAEPTPLSDEMRQVLLAVPDHISVVADSIVNSELTNAASAREKAEAIRNYFQGTYTYSTKIVQPSRPVDPIVYFLEEKHPAHCEFFATAAAMILRRAEVPTRYITGYVADEASEEDGFWIARNSDAHAWVEAYDDKTQTWFPVEATPGRSYQTVSFASSDSLSPAASVTEDESTELDSDTLLGKLASWWAILQSNDPLMTSLRYSQLPLLIIVGTLVWLRRRWIHQAVVDPVDIQSHKLLSKVDRRIRRQGVVRKPHETLHQFANRIEKLTFENGEKYTPNHFANWYRDYGNARYQGQLPLPFERST